MRYRHFGGARPCLLGLVVLVLLLLWQLDGPAGASVARDEHSALGAELQIPVTVWSDDAVPATAVVVAVHGLVMHGGSFDTLARRLAAQGCLVVAPDMRGHGRWLGGGSGLQPDGNNIDYLKSEGDLAALVVRLKAGHPHLPLFLVGESLGASLSIRVAATRPGSVDGLVLSSPAVKHRYLPLKRAVMDARGILTPHRQIDLTPYIEQCASEDPKIIEGMMQDPLVRKHLNSLEVLKTMAMAQSTLKYAKAVEPGVPVLIIQGDADRLLKSNAVVALLGRLRCKDETVRWFHARGHVLLETAFIRADTLETVQGWLGQHARAAAVQTASTVSEMSPVKQN